MSVIPLQREIEYPDSDGRPMAESDVHRREMVYLIQALQRWYGGDPDVYVAGNLLVYYVEGDPRFSVAPDVFVVKGVPSRDRDVYKLWEEGHPPSLVIEVTSNSTRHEDLRNKKDLYEQLGVEEYFLHDPRKEHLTPPLQGFRLVDGKYRPIETSPAGELSSRVTGLSLRRKGGRLRLVDPATGKVLPGFEEMDEQAQALEEEVERLQKELRKRREDG
ncbi:MAG TPA: Uma2 family endonuclease [Thermoanaerobaculia bacterium]